MKTTDALTIRSRDVICGGRAVVVDGLLKVLPLRREPRNPGRRSSSAPDTAFGATVVSRGSATTRSLPAMAGTGSGAFGE